MDQIKCSICFQEIIDNEIIEPLCESSFHKDHLAAWLLTNINCPMCRLTIPTDLRDELKPKTLEEREKLEGVRDEFAIFFKQAGKTDIENWNKIQGMLHYILYLLSISFSFVIWYYYYVLRGDTGPHRYFLVKFIVQTSFVFTPFFSILYLVLIGSEITNRTKRWRERVFLQLFLAILPFSLYPRN